jgi:hypothetical protein
MSADAGLYAIAGQAAALLAEKVINAEAGSYAISGQDASLFVARQLSSDAGTYIITGQAATLDYVYVLSAAAGAYLVNGQDATLVRGTLFPAPSDVRAGVVYGPGGIYIGTMAPGALFVFDD